MEPEDVFKKRNLSKVDFEYEELIGRNFANTNLKNVDLKNRDIHNANFSGADLSGSNLSDTILFNVKLRGANLH